MTKSIKIKQQQNNDARGKQNLNPPGDDDALPSDDGVLHGDDDAPPGDIAADPGDVVAAVPAFRHVFETNEEVFKNEGFGIHNAMDDAIPAIQDLGQEKGVHIISDGRMSMSTSAHSNFDPHCG